MWKHTSDSLEINFPTVPDATLPSRGPEGLRSLSPTVYGGVLKVYVVIPSPSVFTSP